MNEFYNKKFFDLLEEIKRDYQLVYAKQLLDLQERMQEAGPIKDRRLELLYKFPKKSQSLTAKYEGTAQELDVLISRLLEKTGGDKTKNPLYGKGKSFIESGEKHHVNPSVLVAIAMHESGRGTSSMARNRNNIGGLIGKNGALRFNKVEDCIESMAKTIEKHTKNDILTIEQLGRSGKYCAKSAGDRWAEDVVFYINKL